jgi:hypothetical protein
MTDEEVDALAQEDATKALVMRASGEPPGWIDKYMKPAALPTAGGIVGGMAGASFGPWGAVAGNSLGSMAGEAGNQALGITEPSMGNIALAGGVPAAMGAATQLAKPVMAFAGAKGAQMLNALAPDEATLHLAKLQPKVPSAVLFKTATDAQVKIPMNRTLHAIDDMLDEVADVSRGTKAVNSVSSNHLKGLKDLLLTNPQGLSPKVLQRELEAIGHVKAGMGKSTKGGGAGRLDQVFKHMSNDLDDAAEMASAAQPGARALVAARATWKKESVLKEIGEEITNVTKDINNKEGVSFNAAAVKNKLRKNEFYEEALSEFERKDFEDILTMLKHIPALRPGAGQQYGYGVGGKITRFAAGGAGVGHQVGKYAGQAFGVEGLEIPGAVAGGIIGGSSPYIAEFGRNFTTAMSMDTGRALMKQLLTESKGTVTPQVASVIAAYAEAVRAGSVND